MQQLYCFIHNNNPYTTGTRWGPEFSVRESLYFLILPPQYHKVILGGSRERLYPVGLPLGTVCTEEGGLKSRATVLFLFKRFVIFNRKIELTVPGGREQEYGKILRIDFF
jgi:hypothetical protein